MLALSNAKCIQLIQHMYVLKLSQYSCNCLIHISPKIIIELNF